MANKIFLIVDGEMTDVTDKGIKGVTVRFGGDGNTVVIGNGCKFSETLITVDGNYNYVNIGNSCSVSSKLCILVNGKYNCRKVTIGNGTYIGDTFIQVINDNASVEIGNDCMFSSDVTIINDISVDVYDVNTGEDIYSDKNITIGDHVWLGRRAFIGPSTIIASNCIVGTGSYVSGRFLKSNCSIAGNPARIIKRNVDFFKCCIDDFEKRMDIFKKEGK